MGAHGHLRPAVEKKGDLQRAKARSPGTGHGAPPDTGRAAGGSTVHTRMSAHTHTHTLLHAGWVSLEYVMNE